MQIILSCLLYLCKKSFESDSEESVTLTHLQFCMCVHSKLGARKTISSIVKLHVPKSNSIPFSENWHTSKNVCKLITNYIFNTILAMIQIILHNILSY